MEMAHRVVPAGLDGWLVWKHWLRVSQFLYRLAKSKTRHTVVTANAKHQNQRESVILCRGLSRRSFSEGGRTWSCWRISAPCLLRGYRGRGRDVDSLVPTRSALAGLCFQPNSFRRFPNDSSVGMELFQLTSEGVNVTSGEFLPIL